MLKILTETECQFLCEILEDAFNIAKSYDEMESMIDIASAIQMLGKLQQKNPDDID